MPLTSSDVKDPYQVAGSVGLSQVRALLQKKSYQRCAAQLELTRYTLSPVRSLFVPGTGRHGESNILFVCLTFAVWVHGIYWRLKLCEIARAASALVAGNEYFRQETGGWR